MFFLCLLSQKMDVLQSITYALLFHKPRGLLFYHTSNPKLILAPYIKSFPFFHLLYPIQNKHSFCTQLRVRNQQFLQYTKLIFIIMLYNLIYCFVIILLLLIVIYFQVLNLYEYNFYCEFIIFLWKYQTLFC